MRDQELSRATWAHVFEEHAAGVRGASYWDVDAKPGERNLQMKLRMSRSKIKLQFDDKKKEFLVETPGGNRLFFSDDEKSVKIEDQNGNKITMDPNGIKIESAKDLQVKAAAEFKAEGVNTSLKGSGQMKLEGGSGAEISSGGNTAVKGSLVQIN